MDALPEVVIATIGAMLKDARDRCGLAIALASRAPHALVRSQEILGRHFAPEYPDHLPDKIRAVLRSCPNLTDIALNPVNFDAALIALLATARDRIGSKPRILVAYDLGWLAHMDVVDIDILYVHSKTCGVVVAAAEPVVAVDPKRRFPRLVNILQFQQPIVPQDAFDVIARSALRIGSMLFRSMASLDAVQGVDVFFSKQQACRRVIVDERDLSENFGGRAASSASELVGHVTELFCKSMTRTMQFVAANIDDMRAFRRLHIDAIDSYIFYCHYTCLSRFLALGKRVELCFGANLLSNPSTEVVAKLALAAGMNVRLHSGRDAFDGACGAILAYKLGLSSHKPAADLAVYPGLGVLFGIS